MNDNLEEIELAWFQNELCDAIKIAVLTHNMDLNRLKEVTVKDKNRYRKYKYWKEYLMDEEK